MKQKKFIDFFGFIIKCFLNDIINQLGDLEDIGDLFKFKIVILVIVVFQKVLVFYKCKFFELEEDFFVVFFKKMFDLSEDYFVFLEYQKQKWKF